jgi:hypothetical protein
VRGAAAKVFPKEGLIVTFTAWNILSGSSGEELSWSSDGRYILAAVAEGDSDIVLLEGLTNIGRD